ncbi:MAG: MBL fold metallo-hydrolase [Coprococcus sp.]|nr:MBL fold metallo-hydrolase [Coprococcus sp.]
MERIWKVSVWGVRGAMPKADRDYLNYGGNTSCISVDCGEEFVIFDAGSGLLPLSGFLQSKNIKKVHILLSHLHLDHIIGLPAFPLLYDSEAEIHLYGQKPEGTDLQTLLGRAVGPPYWPLGFGKYKAALFIHELCADESFLIGRRLCVGTLLGSHPDSCLYYRLEQDGREVGGGGDKSIVYALDCELTEEIAEHLIKFSRNCRLLVWDSNFTPEDIGRHRGWGHSTWEDGVQIGDAARVKHLLATHYDLRYNDEFLKEQESRAKRSCGFIKFAREGMEITL